MKRLDKSYQDLSNLKSSELVKDFKTLKDLSDLKKSYKTK